jgi:hypothetical protein
MKMVMEACLNKNVLKVTRRIILIKTERKEDNNLRCLRLLPTDSTLYLPLQWKAVARLSQAA